MRFSTVLSLAAAVTAVMAFHILEGHPEGVYQVSYNTDGTENHTRIGGIGTKKRSFAVRGATVQNRSAVVSCAPNEGNLNGNDYYAIAGCSVAYFCNFSGVHEWQRLGVLQQRQHRLRL